MGNWKEDYIKKITHEFQQKKVLVIGDLMVDKYITGKVKRISPEAPVPVLDFGSARQEAGGASNVAHNIKALGADVSIIGVAARDDTGLWLREHFNSMGIDTSMILSEAGRPTTLKTRYATKGQQLLRVDNEVDYGIHDQTKLAIREFLEAHVEEYNAVVLSDYRKGMLEDTEFVQWLLALCEEKEVLVSVDSKSRNINAFLKADFVKPNNLELEEAVNIHIEDDDTLNQAGKRYLDRSGAKALVVTRGSSGISVFEPDMPRRDFPAKDVPVYDVCGAGDTVISTITMGMISGLPIGEAVRLANLAAGVVINKVGTVAVTQKELVDSINEEKDF